MKVVIALILLFVFTTFTNAGTGVGNFIHHYEDSFDFHIAHPSDWGFSSKQISNNKVWEISNIKDAGTKELSSWLKVEFINNFPAASAKELLTEVSKRHPQLQWTKSINDAFVGFRSNDISDGNKATLKYEYFLTNPNQVAFITERSHPFNDGALKIQLISQTIDRSSAPPEITDIWMDKKSNESYQVGDDACYFVKINDLKDGFQKNGLESFQVAGQISHWAPKSYIFDKNQGLFKVCLKVTSQFSKDDLVIRSIGLLNIRSQSIFCSSGHSNTLVCLNSSKKTYTKSDWPTVSNANPDKTGPSVSVFEFNEKDTSLSLVASDDSDLYMAQVFFDHGVSFIIYTDQFISGRFSVDIKKYLREGWNLVSKMIIYDKNGYPTLLRVPQVESSTQYLKSKNVNYEIINSDGKVQATQFPVIHFLMTNNRGSK